MAKIRSVYALYGFEAVETPFIEYTEALGKFLPDQDRPNEGVFSFKDDDEQWLSLRYDLTAPLARYVAENYDRLPKPYRSYRAGWVFRNEKPGPGRYRQFMQFDADTVGAASVAADAEICMMAADCLEALGIKRGDYVVKVNNRKVLDGLMEAIGLGGADNAGRRLTSCARSISSIGSGRMAFARCSAPGATTIAATSPAARNCRALKPIERNSISWLRLEIKGYARKSEARSPIDDMTSVSAHDASETARQLARRPTGQVIGPSWRRRARRVAPT